ncbi:MAG TPA: hypothetical protein VFO06_02440 [Gemmatimonadales bacterium]|nr:hypothetical protein [Gemmatimonadales bacterium]
MSRVRGCRVVLAVWVLLAAAACTRKPSEKQLQAWNAEMQRLQVEQDSLRARAAVLVASDPQIKAIPKGDVVIAVPTAFVQSVMGRLFTDVVSKVTLRLSGIKAHVAKSVKKIVKVGEFVLDVDSITVVGKLKPQEPGMAFTGNRVSLSLPVEVVEGTGGAKLHFVWDGKNVADLTCGDMDVTQKVTGSVIPTKYMVSGTLRFALTGNQVIGTMAFPETRLNIRVTPSKASWAAIDSILAEKHGACGWVLDKVDVKGILANIVQTKGFNVKLPLDKLKPFRIPAGVSDSVKVGERRLALSVKTNLIRIDPEAIWYSADLELK